MKTPPGGLVVRRYLILLSGILIQVCLGGIYAWSTFVPPLQDTYGLSTAQTQILFGMMIALFTTAMVFSGRMLERVGPRWVALTGAVLFAAGYLVASLSGGRFIPLLSGLGLLAGLGTGFGYVCPLATMMKWFPEHKGLVTGLAVAGFGGGAVLLSITAERLMAGGVGVLDVFRWIGFGYGLVIFLSALVLSNPGTVTMVRNRPALLPGELFTDRFFLMMGTGIFTGTFAGLLVIGNLKPLILSLQGDSSLPGLAIVLFSAGNAAGRIVWGFLTDRLGKTAIPLSLLSLFLPLFLAGAFAPVPAVLLPSVFLVGCGFGSCFVVYSVLTAAEYGIDRFGRIYPVVFLFYGLAGISGPWIGGGLFDRTSDYRVSLLFALATMLAGTVAVLILGKSRLMEKLS
jgi:OFA family oxalate/formate antiporter-like MFS transporter